MTETGNYSTGLRSGKARHLEREEPGLWTATFATGRCLAEGSCERCAANHSWSLAMVIAVRRPAPTFLGYTPSLQNAGPHPYDATVTGFLKVP
jgi:hypothetical protein